MKTYRPDWLDQLALAGEIAWGRLFGSGNAPLRAAPIALFPRPEVDAWLALAAPVDASELSWPARAVLDALAEKGALFTDDLARKTKLLSTDLERGLSELVARGMVTSDSFASLRAFLLPAHKRKSPIAAAGRWSLFRSAAPTETRSSAAGAAAPDAEFAARALLRRYGVLFRALLERERLPVPWRDMARAARALELRGELRGGRFVAGFAVRAVRAPRRGGAAARDAQARAWAGGRRPPRRPGEPGGAPPPRATRRRVDAGRAVGSVSERSSATPSSTPPLPSTS
jgi:ATP-dependent Lhr-like helicase